MIFTRLSDLIKILILFYPSVPYIHIGFGDNIPFVILSLIYLLTLKKVRFDRILMLLIVSIGFTTLSFLIHRTLGHCVEIKYTFLGLRNLFFNFIILTAIFNISKNESSKFIMNGLFYGIIFSFTFGVLELFIPKLMANDFIFHYPRSLSELGWLTGENSRIRLLWSEPSYAGGWFIVFALPIILLLKKNHKLLGIFFLVLFATLFMVMNPKSSILILIFSAVLTYLLKLNLIKLFFNSIKIGFVLGITGTIFFLVYEERAKYILDILHFAYNLIIHQEFSIKYVLAQEQVSSSQTIRLIKILTYLNLMWHEKYTFIIGVTPYGIDELIGRHINLIDKSILGLSNFTISEKISFQSTFFESIAWYSIFYAYFIFKVLIRFYKNMKYIFSYDTAKYLTIFASIYITIIINPHIIISLYSLSCFYSRLKIDKGISVENFSPN